MLVIYAEYTEKDEVMPHLKEIIGYAEHQEEVYDYLKQYKMPDYRVFEEPRPHLPQGSLSFRISNNLVSVFLVAEHVQPLDQGKMITFPGEQEGKP